MIVLNREPENENALALSSKTTVVVEESIIYQGINIYLSKSQTGVLLLSNTVVFCNNFS
jgi:hypothetical protein